MSFIIILKPEAEQELLETVAWYESEQIGLGISFIDAIEDLFTRLEQNPYVFSVRYRDVRMGLTKRFPYAIHYIIESEKVIVLAILHTKRKPKD